MLALVAATMLAQQTPEVPLQPVLDSYIACVRKNALAWSKGPDPARDIVAAAIARCGTEENAARDAFVGNPPTDGDRLAMQKFQYRETLFGGVLEGVERRALALVIEARAAR